MPIKENIADFIKRYKEEEHLSVAGLSERLEIAKSAVEIYLTGKGNPRADTLELLAEKCGVSAAEIISAYPPGWGQAETVSQAARLFSGLPPERRDSAVKLFLALVDVLSETNHS